MRQLLCLGTGAAILLADGGMTARREGVNESYLARQRVEERVRGTPRTHIKIGVKTICAAPRVSLAEHKLFG